MPLATILIRIRNKRYKFPILIGLLVLFTYLVVPPIHIHIHSLRPLRFTGGELSGTPPTYEKLHQWERDLPQHNLSLPYPEGRHGRYVKFSTQITGLGWNNVFNEILLCAHLAYQSRRAYVFQDYGWATGHFPWKLAMMPWQKEDDVQPHTPLNALVSGPMAGGPWDEGDSSPRSISSTWFDVVCPRSERRILYTDNVKNPVRDSPGDEVFAHWERILRDAPERCIEIVRGPSTKDGFPQVFDLWVISTARVLPLWESFSKSPTSRLLGTSPLVSSAVYRNEYLFNPRGPRPPHPAPRNPYDRMLALHIRRGDFEDACVGFATWNSTFYNWNLIEFLPDKFTPPQGGSWGKNTPENIEKYLEHCLPTIDGIAKKVQSATRAYLAEYRDHTLDIIYIATNADSEWLELMRKRLTQDGWNTIVTSKDLELDPEQIGVGMAVDMDIARQASVFIGNGWSSLTSNIIHRRLVDGRVPISNRFW